MVLTCSHNVSGSNTEAQRFKTTHDNNKKCFNSGDRGRYGITRTEAMDQLCVQTALVGQPGAKQWRTAYPALAGGGGCRISWVRCKVRPAVRGAVYDMQFYVYVYVKPIQKSCRVLWFHGMKARVTCLSGLRAHQTTTQGAGSVQLHKPMQQATNQPASRDGLLSTGLSCTSEYLSICTS